MFTVKYINAQGEENITECAVVIADRTDDGFKRVLVFDEIPNADKCNHSGVYAESRGGSTSDIPGMPCLYVMNRFGATVATYRL